MVGDYGEEVFDMRPRYCGLGWYGNTSALDFGSCTPGGSSRVDDERGFHRLAGEPTLRARMVDHMPKEEVGWMG